MAGGAGILINIDVPDLKRGIAFYEGGLGFTLLRTLFGGAVAEMARAEGGPRLYLIEAAEGSNAVPRPDTLRADTPRTDASRTYAPRTYSPHWTPVHLDIAVDDIDAALAQALAAGASRSGEAMARDWGTVVPLRDPFGHGLCLIRFREGGYDRVADPAPTQEESGET